MLSAESETFITLTTDFGYRDPLAAIMKGVILSINPAAHIIDITHDIRKYNIREAALIVGMSYHEFPPRTIHMAVTDPGVGSVRRPILVSSNDHYFIGPDNGVFSLVTSPDSRHCRVYHITAAHYFRKDRSATFHGRDIFAPVAAWLSKGIEAMNFGEEIDDFLRLQFPVPSMPTKTALEGEVVYVDTFGNAITNIGMQDLASLRSARPGGSIRIVMKGREVPFKEYYSQAEDKDLYALINSLDRLELFVYRGSAVAEYSINIGDPIGVMLV